MIEPLVTAGEVAETLGFSKDWVLDKWEAGELPGFRIGARKGSPVRFRLSEIEAWLDDKKEGPRVTRQATNLKVVKP